MAGSARDRVQRRSCMEMLMKLQVQQKRGNVHERQHRCNLISGLYTERRRARITSLPMT
jgi:hypothetical protein